MSEKITALTTSDMAFRVHKLNELIETLEGTNIYPRALEGAIKTRTGLLKAMDTIRRNTLVKLRAKQ